MGWHLVAGRPFYLAYTVPELAPFETVGMEGRATPSLSAAPAVCLSRRTIGWVGGDYRHVELWLAPPGVVLRTAGGSDFYIPPEAQTLVRLAHHARSSEGGGDTAFRPLTVVPYQPPQARAVKVFCRQPARPAAETVAPHPCCEEGEAAAEAAAPPSELRSTLSELDRQILLGPALVLALAMRGAWCLHASAVAFRGQCAVLLGDSGFGKSTLAAFLSDAGQPDWVLVADDIVPLAEDASKIEVLPRFPQPKLPIDEPPGLALPERLPLAHLFALAQRDDEGRPDLQLLPPSEAVQTLVRHTAGSRLFVPELLARHLSFCARATEQVPVYRLSYPHRRDVLPAVKSLLESLS